MRNLINRFAWRNLPVQTKFNLLLAFQILLLIAVAVTSTVLHIAADRRIEENVDFGQALLANINAAEQAVFDLEQIEEEVMLAYIQPGFDMTGPIYFIEHGSSLEEARANAIQIRSLVESAESIPAERRRDLLAELDSFEENLTEVEAQFAEAITLLRALAPAESGALAILEQRSNEFRITALARADNVDDPRASATLIGQIADIAEQERILRSDDQDDSLTTFSQLLDAYLMTYGEEVSATSTPFVVLRDAADRYREQAQITSDLLVDLGNNRRAAALDMDDLSRSSALLKSQANALYAARTRNLEEFSATRFLWILFSVGLLIIASAAALYLFGQNIQNTLQVLLDTAKKLEEGSFAARASIRGSDEFSQLGISFNALAIQLEGLVGGLEQRVAEATRDLTITAEIGRAVTEFSDPRELMNQIVELVRERFGFYHVQIFIVDEATHNANLVASTGTAGRELLSRRHYLPVGSQSVIGQVTASARPVVALDTDTSVVHRRNELLPDTRSEMALPMRIGERVIGALDVQSVAPNAFDEDDIAVFQIMADQLAIALDNARLNARLSDVSARLEQIERSLTADAWRAFQQAREAEAPLGYRFMQDTFEPLHQRDALPAMSRAISTGEIVAQNNGDSDLNLAVPITVRGEVIGAFGFSGQTLVDLSDEDLALIEAVVDRVGLALENLRLVDQTARRVEYEQIVNEITSKIVGSTDVNYILQTTVRELGRVLRVRETTVKLRGENG